MFEPKLYEWDRYLWAWELLYSNGMEVVFPGGERKTCLVPVAGLFNHSLCPHILHGVSVDPETDSLKFMASRPCIEGEECYLSYGNLSASDLLVSYGFLSKGRNHHDVLYLGFDVDDFWPDHELRPDESPRDLMLEYHMLRGGGFSIRALPEPLLPHLFKLLGAHANEHSIERKKASMEASCTQIENDSSFFISKGRLLSFPH